MAAGPAVPAGAKSAHAATQGAWRFLNNDDITLLDLVQPLREAGRAALELSASKYALVVHDWCKLDYKTHKAKSDVFQLTHKNDIGYDLTTSLLVDAGNGACLAPVQMHLKTSDAVHSTAAVAPKQKDHHLEQLLPTMNEIGGLNLPRQLVHIIDREADSLGHFRKWDRAGHLFLVRADDRRVRWNDTSMLLSEIVKKLEQQRAFKKTREVSYRGKTRMQTVAETTVVLHKKHKTRRNGKQRQVAGPPLTMRLVVARVIANNGKVLAEWMLLTNVPAGDVAAAEIALWYYWRWQIESFFKLLKSHGLDVEYWLQENGKAIARRLLVAAMACVVVWKLENDQSPDSEAFKQVLVQLSGRRMKHGVKYTTPALLAGYFVLLAMIAFLRDSEYTLKQLIELHKKAAGPFADSG